MSGLLPNRDESRISRPMHAQGRVINVQQPSQGLRGRPQQQMGTMGGAPFIDSRSQATPSRQYGLRFARRSIDRANGLNLTAQGMAQQQANRQEDNERADFEQLLSLIGGVSRSRELAGTPTAATVATPETPEPTPEAEERVAAFNARARGGKINGPGTSKSDSIPAYLSDGEYVLPAETVEQIGTQNLNQLVRATTGQEPGPSKKKQGLRDFGAYASGGRVHESIPERPGPAPKRVDNAPVGAGFVKQAVKNLVGLRGRTERLEKEALGYAQGGRVRQFIDESNANLANQGMLERPSYGNEDVGFGEYLSNAVPAVMMGAGAMGLKSAAASRAARSGAMLTPAAQQTLGVGAKVPTLTRAAQAVGGLGSVAGGAAMLSGDNAAVETTVPTPAVAPQAGPNGMQLADQDVAAAAAAAQVQQPETTAAMQTRVRSANEDMMGLRGRMQAAGGGADPRDPGAAGLRALRENPEMVTEMNDIYGRMGNGIQASVGEGGRIMFSGNGANARANYTGRDGKPTKDWSETADYRDAMIRNASSSDPQLRRQGMPGLAELAARRQSGGVQTGNETVDRLLAQGVPLKDAVSVARLDGSGSNRGPKAAPFNEQVTRIAQFFGGDEKKANQIMPELMAAQVSMAAQAVQSGQMTEAEAEAAAQSGLFMNELGRRYALREFLEQNRALVKGVNTAGTGALIGTGVGLASALHPATRPFTKGLTAGGAALGSALGGAVGNNRGVGNFQNVNLEQLGEQLAPRDDGDFDFNGMVIPKALVDQRPDLFGFSQSPRAR